MQGIGRVISQANGNSNSSNSLETPYPLKEMTRCPIPILDLTSKGVRLPALANTPNSK